MWLVFQEFFIWKDYVESDVLQVHRWVNHRKCAHARSNSYLLQKGAWSPQYIQWFIHQKSVNRKWCIHLCRKMRVWWYLKGMLLYYTVLVFFFLSFFFGFILSEITLKMLYLHTPVFRYMCNLWFHCEIFVGHKVKNALKINNKNICL